MERRTYRIPAIDIIGRMTVEAAMRNQGYQRPDRAIIRWVQRKHVPSDARFMLLDIAENEGKNVVPADCVIERIRDRVQFRSGRPIPSTVAKTADEDECCAL